jgi:hypothetical protein
LVGFIAGFAGLRQKKCRAALYLLLAGTLAGIIVFYPADRFRLPMATLLMIFGGYGLVKIITFAWRREFVKALLSLLVAIGLSYLLKMPARHGGPGLVRPEDYRNMGWAYMENPTHRDLIKAEYYLIKSWNESARLRYPINPAGKSLGALEQLLATQDIEKGNYQNALEKLRRAETAYLCNSETKKLKSVALLGMGQTERAMEAEQEASMLAGTLPRERHLELALKFSSRYEMENTYCHLLAASILEENPELKKELQMQIAEILMRIETQSFEAPPESPR